MKIFHRLALSALTLLPASAYSHPGHGHGDIHSLLHSEHVVILVSAALAASVLAWLVKNR